MTRLFSLCSILALVTVSLAQGGPNKPIYTGSAFVEAEGPGGACGIPGDTFVTGVNQYFLRDHP